MGASTIHWVIYPFLKIRRRFGFILLGTSDLERSGLPNAAARLKLSWAAARTSLALHCQVPRKLMALGPTALEGSCLFGGGILCMCFVFP